MLSPEERAALLQRLERVTGPEMGELYPEAFLDRSNGFLCTLDYPKDRFPTKFGVFVIFKKRDFVCPYLHGLN